nr:oligopeptide/dipeptide ABC transporter ATP-binding protein [Candidatus Hakubella thermalkaliphila]
MSAVPVPNPRFRRKRAIPRGEIPSPINPPSGCRFHPRCLQAIEICSQEEPELKETKEGHRVACHLRA